MQLVWRMNTGSAIGWLGKDWDCGGTRSGAALCLGVDGGHVAQAAVEGAHLEENALLRAGRELAPCAALQLLGQAETWNKGHVWHMFLKIRLTPVIRVELPSPAVPVLLVDMWKPFC